MSLCVEIQKRLGNFQLDVQFEAHQEPLALLGASGCGKSVTLRCIAGILTPDTGKIVLDGAVLYDSTAHINLPPQRGLSLPTVRAFSQHDCAAEHRRRSA